jgi:uncharacterized membrane protein
VGTMMWGWGAGWGAGWWLLGAVFMVFCMVMMMRMMGHGHSGHGGHDRSDDPQRTLADRLAKGEIDTEEYKRLLDVLRRTNPSARA